MNTLDTERYVTTADICAGIKGRGADVIEALGIPWRVGKPHINCPYPKHTDNNPSWRWDERKARAYCTCITGSHSVLDVVMTVEGADFDAAKIRAAELLGRIDLIRDRGKRKAKGGGGDVPPEHRCNGATASGCRIADYAEAKCLPIPFLRSLGVTEVSYQGAPAIRIPYFAADGREAAARFRVALDSKSRFRWRRGSKPSLYGLDRLADAREGGLLVLVEGESDCHTLWLHDFPALGLPGNMNWNEPRDAPLLADIPVIYIVIEPGQSGDGLMQWLSRSAIAPRARLVRLAAKDSSALYLGDPEGFPMAFQAALNAAEPCQEMADRESEAEAASAKEAAGDLILETDVLGRFGTDIKRSGLAGEERNAKVLYLALTTRLFDRPVNVVIKGPSSGGKNFTVKSVARFFPPEAYWSRTSMSDRTLAYSDEDFRHRHLVIYEASGMTSDIATYLIRSMLSEGCIEYEFVEKTKDGMTARIIRKEGPTGLITTTTEARLHPENETRLLSLAVKDTPTQTRAVMLATADEGDLADGAVDYKGWHAFQRWLVLGERRVMVPFARDLAELIPPVAVRLRRDFPMLLSLIRAHALLHRELRDRDDRGRIVATLGDYTPVRELIVDLFAEGIDATVSDAVRQTVAAVKALGKEEVSVREIEKELSLDYSTASRRVTVAVSKGYLVNNETRKGQRARIALGDPMPSEIEILPHPDRLADHCSVAALSEGYDTPSPRSHDVTDELAEVDV
jgi:hypothetical protein